MTNEYYNKNDVINDRFYQMPKWLLEDQFKDLSDSSRVLYAVLKDRQSLSVSNNWLDENGRVFFYFTRENIAELMNWSVSKSKRIFKELIDYQLIRSVKQGLNKPSKVYLLKKPIENKGSVINEPSGSITDEPSGSVTDDTLMILSINDTEMNETDNNIKSKASLNSYLSSFEESKEQIKNYTNNRNVLIIVGKYFLIHYSRYNKHWKLTEEQIIEICNNIELFIDIQFEVISKYTKYIEWYFDNYDNHSLIGLAGYKVFNRYLYELGVVGSEVFDIEGNIMDYI